MKFYSILFLITVFTTMPSYAQTKTTKRDSLSIEEHLNKKIIETVKLYKNYEYKKALVILKQCIKKSDSLKNDSLIGKSYIMSGIVNSYIGNEAEAISNHRKAEAIYTKMKKTSMLGIIYNNIAFAYSNNSNNTDSTIVYYKKALDTYKLNGNTNKMALTAANLGEIYQKNNQLEKATEYLKKAIDLAKMHNRKRVLSTAYHYYSLIFYKKGDLKKAVKYLNLSQKIAEKENNEQLLVLIYKFKSDLLEKLGDIKNAHIALKKYGKYLDRTHKIEKSRLIQEASIKFEVKEKKTLLEKTQVENIANENKLKKSREIIFLSAILFLIAVIASLLLYKNNTLKLENNKLLTLKNEKLKELQNKTELDFLKTKIQPHFFFNTLTILHTLIIEKSENAKEVVIKLSELMQYSIYEAKKENVSIWNEINSIQNYLDLDGLYKNKKTLSSIEINGNIDHIKVPPLLYFSFIENYFKSNNTRDKDTKLSISFSNLENKYLLFNIHNKINSTELKKETTNEFEIKNIKHRLNLLYNDKYSLITQNINNTFNINLKTPI